MLRKICFLQTPRPARLSKTLRTINLPSQPSSEKSLLLTGKKNADGKNNVRSYVDKRNAVRAEKRAMTQYRNLCGDNLLSKTYALTEASPPASNKPSRPRETRRSPAADKDIPPAGARTTALPTSIESPQAASGAGRGGTGARARGLRAQALRRARVEAVATVMAAELSLRGEAPETSSSERKKLGTLTHVLTEMVTSLPLGSTLFIKIYLPLRIASGN